MRPLALAAPFLCLSISSATGFAQGPTYALGKQIKADRVDQQGNVTPLICQNNWEFNRQGAYSYKQPVTIPTYSTVKLKCPLDTFTILNTIKTVR